MNLPKWLFALVALLLVAGCSATSRRIKANEDLFENYPPEVQAAIRAGRIAHGFDGTQVYLSWGNADRTEMLDGQEVWFYHRTFKKVVQEEKTATEYRLEMAEYEAAVAKGEEHLQEPSTHRTVHLMRVAVHRIVRFEDGVVVAWEEPEGMWLGEWRQYA